MQIFKTYKDRVGRWIILSRDIKSKRYSITQRLGNTFTSFTFTDKKLFDKELNSKYKPELKKI